MAKLTCLFPLSFCLIVLLLGCSARNQPPLKPNGPQEQSECQLDKLDALEPIWRINSEAGKIEFWDFNNSQFQCAGVTVYHLSIDPRGLLQPAYTNAPQLFYVVRGSGIMGALLPGCPETYQTSQKFERERGQRRRFHDQHQKITRLEAGDISALHTGVANWIYNDGNSTLVVFAFVHNSNYANQLGPTSRAFYLAGRTLRQQLSRIGEQEGQQEEEQKGGQEQEGQERGKEEQEEKEQENSRGNMYSGFDTDLVAASLRVNTDTAEKVQGKKDRRGPIVEAKDGLEVTMPPKVRKQPEEREQQPHGQEKERKQEQEQGGGCDNGLEETICTVRLTENIDNPSRADIYVPHVGRISTVNSLTFPILYLLQLSAERVVLYKNAMMAPHYNLNAHSLIYVTRGTAEVQIVDNNGNTVFRGKLSEGNVIVVPQNFGVVIKAGEEGFEYVAFKTADNAMIYTLAGRNSFMHAMPVEVIKTAYDLSRDEAVEVKSNQDQATLLSGRGKSERNRWAIV